MCIICQCSECGWRTMASLSMSQEWEDGVIKKYGLFGMFARTATELGFGDRVTKCSCCDKVTVFHSMTRHEVDYLHDQTR